MKKLLLASTIVLITSCGVTENYCDNNDSANAGCELLLGDKEDGEDGQDGADGKDGVDGKDGQMCTVEAAVNGSIVSCGDNAVFIADGSDGLNGADGTDGSNGQDGSDGSNGIDAIINPHSITEIIDPCGDNVGQFDEVLLKTYDGQYLAYFENRGKRFLTVLEYNTNYRTTDKQQCNFRIDVNGNFSDL